MASENTNPFARERERIRQLRTQIGACLVQRGLRSALPEIHAHSWGTWRLPVCPRCILVVDTQADVPEGYGSLALFYDGESGNRFCVWEDAAGGEEKKRIVPRRPDECADRFVDLCKQHQTCSWDACVIRAGKKVE